MQIFRETVTTVVSTTVYEFTAKDIRQALLSRLDPDHPGLRRVVLNSEADEIGEGTIVCWIQDTVKEETRS